MYIFENLLTAYILKKYPTDNEPHNYNTRFKKNLSTSPPWKLKKIKLYLGNHFLRAKLKKRITHLSLYSIQEF